MNGLYYKLILLLIALWGLYIITTLPEHPVWINAGDFLNYNASK